MFYIYWFVYTYWFLHVIMHVCSWSSSTISVEKAAARSWSWFKWEDRGGVVIWWKTRWHIFLRGQLREILVWKSRPFREFPVLRKGRGQAGRGYYEHASKNFSRKPYRLYQSCSWQHNALWHRSAHNIYADTSTTQATVVVVVSLLIQLNPRAQTALFNLGRKMF